MSSKASLTSGRIWLALVLTLLACGLLSLLWCVLALQTGRQCSWMALAVSFDAAICLRLLGVTPGMARGLAALTFTVVGTVVANWGIVSLQMAWSFGLGPVEAASKLGIHHAMILLGLATGPLDHLFLLASLVVAFWAGR